MAKKMNPIRKFLSNGAGKSIPRFLVVTVLMVGLVIGLNVLVKNVKADTAGTSVTVGNVAPAWTVVPADSSDGTTPTDAGTDVTFTATGTDSNADNYYLAICKSNTITPVDSAAPTCPGGSWAISTSTASGVEASVTYATLAGDAESNIWYGFVCDHNAASACSAMSNAASPFKVNHWPRFSYQTNCGTVNPGATCNITTAGQGNTTATNAETFGTGVVVEVPSTAGFAVNDYVWYAGTDPERTQVEAVVLNTSITLYLDYDHAVGDAITEIGCEDTDSDTAVDTVSLYVCKTASFTPPSTCDGGTWCSATAQARNPACNATAPIPSEGAQNYYPYVIDSHSFASTDTLQGSTQSFTVDNVAPVVSAVSLNSNAAITLTQAYGDALNYTNINVTGTITDDNGCGDIVEDNTKADVFTDDIAHGACDANAEDDANFCYALTACTLDTGSCTGGTDLDSTYTCTVGFYYHADPTVAGTPKAAYEWTAFLNSKDEALNATPVEVGTKVEMNDFVSLDVTSTIAYGNLAVGEIADGTALPQTTTVTEAGNTGLDVTLYGTDMTGAGTIVVGKQKYAATAVTYGTATALLVTPGVEHELDCLKTTVTATPQTKAVYWGLQVPDGTPSGGYTGTNTFVGVMDEVPW